MTSCTLNLHEFLEEAELQHYYNALWSDLKVTGVSQLKYVQEEDLNSLGMSRPEQRRLKKFFNKYYPQTYLGKFVKIIHTKTSSSSSQSGASRRNSGVEQWEVRSQVGRDLAAKHATPSSTTRHGLTARHVIPLRSVRLGQLLGSAGYFGSVHQALWTQENGHSLVIDGRIDRVILTELTSRLPTHYELLLKQVAVKCLDNERIHCSATDCLKNIAGFVSLEHDRIVRFYGGGLTDEDEPSVWLVMELAPHRSLLECIRDPLLKTNLTVMTLCDMAEQICEGMKYLEAVGLVHGDLATRNVLVFSKLKVKISDVGLSRILEGKESVRAGADIRHAAWRAPEYLQNRRISGSCDIWAFGVTLWELFSFGLEPFAGYTASHILEFLSTKRLDQPDLCPKDYYRIMLDCWNIQELDRPSFSRLSEILPEKKPEQLQAIRDCLDLTSSCGRKQLQYATGDVIVVLDNNLDDGGNFWKGVVKSRKPGLFDPSETVTYLGSDMLPTSEKLPDSQSLTDGKGGFGRKSKIRRDMISRPQGDFRHTGHVGMDGSYFGDISLLNKGIGPASVLGRSYDKGEDESSMGYGGSRDTTPLISSRMSIPRTIGSESRMSSESWRNTNSSDSPRSGSSHSSGNAKENHPSPSGSRKASISPPQLVMGGGWKSNVSQRSGSRYGDQQHEYADRCDGVDKPTGTLNGVKKPFIHSLHPNDDKQFDLDFGPSLMEEVFGVLNGNCGNSDTMSCLSDFSGFKDSTVPSTVRNSQTSLPSQSSLPSYTEAVVPVATEMLEKADEPIVAPIVLRPVEILPSPSVVRPKEASIPVKALPPKPAPPTKPPKPQVIARKKLDPISVVRDESAIKSSIKPASPRDERLIDDFIDTSNEVAAKSLAFHSAIPSSSPTTSSKSRFSFRGFRSKTAEPVPPERPKIFLSVEPQQEKKLEDALSDDAKEAYRVLVEEGQIRIHCPPPTPAIEEEEDESSSPLKLLRNRVGVVPKQRGNRGGLSGFSRSISHDASRVTIPLSVEEPVSSSHSLRTSQKPAKVNAVANTNGLNSSLPFPQPDLAMAKKVERPNVPPPLPPRDRSKPAVCQTIKPRERKYPLIPGGSDNNTQPELTAEECYQNPELDGLVVEKSHNAVFRKLSNGVGMDALRNQSSLVTGRSGREVSF